MRVATKGDILGIQWSAAAAIAHAAQNPERIARYTSVLLCSRSASFVK